MLAVEIEKDFKEENSMTNFAKERMKSKDVQTFESAKSF